MSQIGYKFVLVFLNDLMEEFSIELIDFYKLLSIREIWYFSSF